MLDFIFRHEWREDHLIYYKDKHTHIYIYLGIYLSLQNHYILVFFYSIPLVTYIPQYKSYEMFSLDYFTSTILWIVGFVFLTYPVYVLLKGSHQGCLPPGPTPLPLIGNLHQIPKQGQWLKFTEWGKEYGPIMYLNMGGQPFIVLSSHEAALDLLSRRSSQYSDRPRLVMCGEIITKGMHILIRPYDAAYRLHQRMEAPLLNIQAARCYRPLQDLESRQLLFDALKESDSAGEQGVNIHHHIERAMASFVYCLEYGYRLQTGYEQQVQDANQVLEAFTQNAMPGVNIVDTFPILNHLPSFLAPWKAKGEKIFGLERNLHVGNMHKGLKNPGWNFAKHYVHSCPEAKGMPEVEIAFDLGILADAALDTSSAALKWLFVAWVTCGEKWVAKAQQIIDDTVGRDRLPQFEDREALSYIDAIGEFTPTALPTPLGTCMLHA